MDWKWVLLELSSRVAKIKELETEVKRLNSLIDGYDTINGELSLARRRLEDGIKEQKLIKERKYAYTSEWTPTPEDQELYKLIEEKEKT